MLALNKNINGLIPFFIAVLFYLPTTHFIPAFIYYLFLPIFFYVGSQNNINYKNFNLIFISLSIAGAISLIAFFLSGAEINYYGNFIPLTLSLIISLFCSLFLNKEVVKFLLVFFIIESIVAYFQKAGVSIPYTVVDINSDVSELMYFNRANGFSLNSSGLAGKALIIIVLFNLYFKKVDNKYKLIINSFVFFTIIASFSRSALTALLGYYFLVYFSRMNLKNYFFISSLILILGIVLYLTPDISDEIFNQFTRGRGNIELTGRDVIWNAYLDTIYNNVFWGNYGLRGYLNIPPYGFMHAHNSYLMSFYIFGLIPFLVIFIPLMIIFIRYPNKITLLSPLLIFSFAQFNLFWGASLTDIAFFTALLYKTGCGEQLSK